MDDDRFGDVQKDPSDRFDRARRETPPGQDVSTTVVLVLEEVTGKPMEELPLLERTIDVESLNNLFKPEARGDSDDPIGTVRFEHAGCTVNVDSEGRVVAQRPNQGRAASRPR